MSRLAAGVTMAEKKKQMEANCGKLGEKDKKTSPVGSCSM
jgi:hypothetical protein